MKPAPFDYVAAASLADAVAVLDADPDAKVIAGGQSLMPLLALRLARPTVLVDIGGLPLDGVTPPAGPHDPLELGALVRHAQLEHDPLLRQLSPLLADAAGQVGYPAIRNRGTLGGSMAHADPAAELPVSVVALQGSVIAVGPDGSREIRAVDLADGFLSTTLQEAEVVVAVRVRPAGARHGAAYCEWSTRDHDFAEVGVGVALELDDQGRVSWLGAAASGIQSYPFPLTDVLSSAGVRGAAGPDATLLRSVAAAVETAGAPAGADRAEMTGLLAARALRKAWDRASLLAGVGGRAA